MSDTIMIVSILNVWRENISGESELIPDRRGWFILSCQSATAVQGTRQHQGHMSL